MTALADTRTTEIAELEAHLQFRLAGRVRDLRLLVRDRGLAHLLREATRPTGGHGVGRAADHGQ